MTVLVLAVAAPLATWVMFCLLMAAHERLVRVCVRRRLVSTIQQFKLEADGRLTVSKYCKWAMRALDGTAKPIIDPWG